MDRHHAHQLPDQFDPVQLSAIGQLLEVMVDPVVRAVAAAPWDGEPLTEQDRRRFHEGHAWFAKRGGKGIPMEEVLAGVGAIPEDFRSCRLTESSGLTTPQPTSALSTAL